VRITPEEGVLGTNGGNGRRRSRTDGREIFIKKRSVSNMRLNIMKGIEWGTRVDRHVGDMREEELEEYIGFCEQILTAGERNQDLSDNTW
jgi:hypothetical protein